MSVNTKSKTTAPTVGYLGLPGSFSYLAAQKYLSSARLISCQTFKQIMEKVKQGQLSLGILPIENSLSGSLIDNYDLLVSSGLFIVGEVYLRIKQNLLSKTKVSLSEIDTVYSHPEAFRQCAKFLEKLPIKKIAIDDTSSAAEYIANQGSKNEAAIASVTAAKIYSLTILKKGIETNKNNFSRFLVVARQRKKDFLTRANKATVLFNLAHRPGTLYQALGVFAKKRMNLTKIESRPILGKPFEYLFILDFEFDSLSQAQAVVEEMRQHTTFQKVLGYYQKGNFHET